MAMTGMLVSGSVTVNDVQLYVTVSLSMFYSKK